MSITAAYKNVSFPKIMCVSYTVYKGKAKIISLASVGKERVVNPLGNLLLPRFVKFINLSAGDSAIYNPSFFLHILTSSSLSATAFHFIFYLHRKNRIKGH